MGLATLHFIILYTLCFNPSRQWGHSKVIGLSNRTLTVADLFLFPAKAFYPILEDAMDNIRRRFRFISAKSYPSNLKNIVIEARIFRFI